MSIGLNNLTSFHNITVYKIFLRIKMTTEMMQTMSQSVKKLVTIT